MSDKGCRTICFIRTLPAVNPFCSSVVIQPDMLYGSMILIMMATACKHYYLIIKIYAVYVIIISIMTISLFPLYKRDHLFVCNHMLNIKTLSASKNLPQNLLNKNTSYCYTQCSILLYFLEYVPPPNKHCIPFFKK
jgi:hypothetical protein